MAEREKSVHLDEVLSKFSILGSYQIQVISLLGFAFLLNGMHCINFIFVAEEVNYRCKIDKCEDSKPSFQSPWYNFTAPQDYRNCYKYGNGPSPECRPDGFNKNEITVCNEWIYEIDNSLVSEFNLGCQDWKRSFIGTVHSLGLMIGLLVQGQLSDRIGRKAAIIISGMLAAFFGLAKSFANSYIMFILLELFEAALGDNCSPAYIMSVETVSNANRLQQQVYLTLFFSIGGVFYSLAAYYVRYWRAFVRVLYFPSFFFSLYYFFMDESPRWLLSKGRKVEATNIILKMAKRNKVDLDLKMIERLECEQVRQNSPLKETFSSKIVIRRFLICVIWWISGTFICFGMFINATSLAGSKYVNFAILSITEIPVVLGMAFILKRYNRKKPLILSFILAGLICILQTFIPNDYPWLSIGMYMIGKCVATFTFTTVYMYTSELFPTNSRNSMHALCSSIGRIGSVMAPMTPLLMQYEESLPTILIGTISIVAGLLTLLVPDVGNDSLPDNVLQAEQIEGASKSNHNNICACDIELNP